MPINVILVKPPNRPLIITCNCGILLMILAKRTKRATLDNIRKPPALPSVASSCGIIERDENDIVTAFYEKKPGNYGNCANGAIYAFESDFIDFVKNLPLLTTDFSCDVIPKLIGKIHTWKTLKSYEDIGSYASLNKFLMLSENKNTNLVDSFPGFVIS